jgi:hypothetical protein
VAGDGQASTGLVAGLVLLASAGAMGIRRFVRVSTKRR